MPGPALDTADAAISKTYVFSLAKTCMKQMSKIYILASDEG